MEQLELLWHLQEVDLAIKKIEEEMENHPLINEVSDIEEVVTEKTTGLEEIVSKVKDQEKVIKRLEQDLQKAVAETKSLSQKLYGGTVSSNRELEQMGKKLELLEKEKESLENKIIGQMEAVESLEEECEFRKNSLEEILRELEEKKEALSGKLKELTEQVSRLQDKRRGLTQQVTPQYLDRYSSFAERHRGKGMARMQNDVCGGCGVFIPSAHRGLLFKPSSLVYCENCGRLLVRLSEDTK